MLFYQKLVEMVLHPKKGSKKKGNLGCSDPGHLVYGVWLPVCFRFANPIPLFREPSLLRSVTSGT